MQEAVDQYQKVKAKPKSKSELLADSYHEMLAGYINIYDRTGDLAIKEIIDRAQLALNAK